MLLSRLLILFLSSGITDPSCPQLLACSGTWLFTFASEQQLPFSVLVNAFLPINHWDCIVIQINLLLQSRVLLIIYSLHVVTMQHMQSSLSNLSKLFFQADRRPSPTWMPPCQAWRRCAPREPQPSSWPRSLTATRTCTLPCGRWSSTPTAPSPSGWTSSAVPTWALWPIASCCLLTKVGYSIHRSSKTESRISRHTNSRDVYKKYIHSTYTMYVFPKVQIQMLIGMVYYLPVV